MKSIRLLELQRPGRHAMTNWFFKKRMEWIDESLRLFGRVSTWHLEQKFELSRTQARNDLSLFRSRYLWKVDHSRSSSLELFRASHMNVRWDDGKPFLEPKAATPRVSE